MKKPVVTGLLLLALSSCTEFTTFYQPGMTKTQRNVDQAQCNRVASDRFPPYIVTDWYPIYNSDGRIIGHRPEQYDVNAGKRYTEARNCMTERGYQRVTIPYCKDEQLAGRNYAPIQVAPELSDNICGLRTEGNNRVLIDLSKPI